MVENGIHILNKYYDGKFGFITVVTKRNYSEINTIVKYFTSVLSLFSGKFNIVRDNANIEGKNLLLNATEIKGFAEDLYCLVEMYNLMGIKFDETNIMTRVRNLTGRENTSCCASNGCYGGISLISFDKYGNIYPCDLTDSEELRIGSIYEGSQRKNGSTLVKMMGDSIKSNRYFDAISDKDCVMCPWNYFCKGGCRAAAYYKNISGVVDEVECLFNKTIYPLIIRSILSKKVWFEKG